MKCKDCKFYRAEDRLHPISNDVVNIKECYALPEKVVLNPLRVEIACSLFDNKPVVPKDTYESERILTPGREDDLIGKTVVFTTVSDGLGYEANDQKYFSGLVGKRMKIMKKYEGVCYVTDRYDSRFKEVRNDYVRDGYIIVSRWNVKVIEEDK